MRDALLIGGVAVAALFLFSSSSASEDAGEKKCTVESLPEPYRSQAIHWLSTSDTGFYDKAEAAAKMDALADVIRATNPCPEVEELLRAKARRLRGESSGGYIPTPPRPTPIPIDDLRDYVIQPGDTPQTVAGTYGMTVPELILANSLMLGKSPQRAVVFMRAEFNPAFPGGAATLVTYQPTGYVDVARNLPIYSDPFSGEPVVFPGGDNGIPYDAWGPSESAEPSDAIIYEVTPEESLTLRPWVPGDTIGVRRF